jgi:two-component system, sensor histidine kinase LadS
MRALAAPCVYEEWCALRRFVFCLLWLCTGLCAPHFAAAQDLARLSDDSPTLVLAAPLQWLAVAKGTVHNPDVFHAAGKAPGFAAYTPSAVLPTSRQSDVWLRFALPITNTPEQWYLRIPHLSIERAVFYFQDNANRWMTLSAGEKVAMGQWPVPSNRVSFALQTRTDRVQTYYLKLEHETALVQRPELISANEYLDDSAQVGILVGLMFGLFSLLGVMAVLTAHSYRNLNFAWFALVVASLLLVQLVLIGYAGQRLWPHSPYLTHAMCWLSWLFFLAASTWFYAQASVSQDIFPKIHKTSIALTALLLCVSVVYAFMPHDFPRVVLNALTGLTIVWIAGSSAWMAWRSHQTWLWYLTTGMVPLALTLFTRIAYNVGWVRHIELAQFFSLLVACLGMLVIYRVLIASNRDAQIIEEREQASIDNDVSTGLPLARTVNVRLPLMMARSERFDGACGVLMVRWLDYASHMEPLTSTQRGAVLSHLGARLSKLCRPIDTVARLDDDHFVFLIEAPISHERLNALGTKILSTCMRPGRLRIDANIYDVHVAVWTSSKGIMATAQVLESLRTRLNQMGNGTSRRVQFVDSALSSRPGGTEVETEVETEIDNTQRSKDIVRKINALEAIPLLPTIITSGRADFLPPPKSKN